MQIRDHISAQIMAVLLSFHLPAYRMDSIKKETKLNVRLEAIRFNEAVYEAECNNSDTDSDKNHQMMATYISRKI